MKTLVIQTAFLGDVVLTTSLLRALRDDDRDGQLDVLVREDLRGVLSGLTWVDSVLGFDKRGTERGPWGLFRKARQLAARGYDRVYVPHRSVRTALLAAAASVPRRIGYRDAPGAWLYTRRVEPVAGHYCERLAGLADSDVVPTPRLETDAESDAAVARRLEDAGVEGQARVALVAPGSVWATKRWTPEGFRQVCAYLQETGYRVILTGSSGDRAAADEVLSELDERVLDWVGETTLSEMVSLAARASLFVGNDSGAMHVAGAVGTPVVAVFGPTTPALGFAPRTDAASAVVEVDLECRPCHAHGPMRCPLGHHDCMRKLEASRVVEAVQRVTP